MPILQVENLTVAIQSKIIFENVSFEIQKDRHYAIVGPSGSGKTTLLHCLAGQSFFKGSIQVKEGVNLVLVEQQHHFKNLSNTSSFYYQQRFNSMDSGDALIVQEYLNEFYSPSKGTEFYTLLGIEKLLDKRLIQLSNGENKRVQLIKALMANPDVLLLDNPLLGLDTTARKSLNGILQSIIDKGIIVIMVTSPQTIPEIITDVLELQEKNLRVIRKGFFVPANSIQAEEVRIDKALLDELINDEDDPFQYAISMNNVHVQYYDKVILDKLNWEVKKGERWSLSGANGAGKSTLLSLINADNPQAYANEIYLFDKRRGKGESIWDIKRRIGYVSPELHLFFDSSNTVFSVVASGLFDTIGLFRVVSGEQTITIIKWMKVLGVDHFSNQLLRNLPLGKQRLVLLARALVKDPPLLLLDEPAQGLDEEQAKLFKNLIEQICEHSNKTLIYVTHLKDEIPSCVTKFIRLENGTVVNS